MISLYHSYIYKHCYWHYIESNGQCIAPKSRNTKAETHSIDPTSWQQLHNWTEMLHHPLHLLSQDQHLDFEIAW